MYGFIAIALILLAAALMQKGPLPASDPVADGVELERECRDSLRRMNDPRCEEFRDVH